MNNLIICILVAAITSWLTTKIIAIKYFNIIDSYVNTYIKDSIEIIKNTFNQGNKK